MSAQKMTIPYRFVRTLLKILIFLLTRTHVRGTNLVPSSGAAIVVCNHLAAADPAFLVAVIPRPVILMSKIENNRGILKPFIRMVGAFTVRRGKFDRQAIRQAEQALAAGYLLGIFPEGTRSHGGELGAGHSGAALLALKTDVPIIPVAVTGTARIFLPRFPWLGFPHVTVTIGEPFHICLPEQTPHRNEREQMTAEIMVRIAALLPPEQRGNHRLTT